MKISLSPAEFTELLLSHHPNKPCFNDDIIIIFRRRICAGCLFAYPTAFIIWLLFKHEGFESIVIAILLAIISQTRRFIHQREINFLFRIVAGIALGFGFGGLLWALNTHNVFAVLLITLSAVIYAVIKYHSMREKFYKKSYV
jgi:uncharacterized membrane protein